MTSEEGSGCWDADLFAQQLRVVGARVRAARQSHAWSQQDLGNRSEIHRGNISRIESGNSITLEVLWRLADTLRVHWADLLDDRTSSPPVQQHTATSFEQKLHPVGTLAYRARAVQRLSQQALAERTGLGLSTIYWVERGTRNVTLETLSRLSAGLGVHWADLLDDCPATPQHHNHEDSIAGFL